MKKIARNIINDEGMIVPFDPYKHAKKVHATIVDRYGSDYYKRISAKRKNHNYGTNTK